MTRYAKKKTVTKKKPAGKLLSQQAFSDSPIDLDFMDKPEKEGCNFTDNLILLYGDKKIGKSTLCSLIPNTYFLATEPGLKSLSVRKQRIPNWPTFCEFVKWAGKNKTKTKDIDCFVIDTVVRLAKQCMQYTCHKKGISHPSDEEWGKGWDAMFDEFTYWILKLEELGKGIIFVGHTTYRDVMSRNVEVTKAMPDIPAFAYRCINPLVDMILFMDYVRMSKNKEDVGTKRCIFTKPSETFEAGDRTSLLPETIPFSTERVALKKLTAPFSKGADDE